jgi:hypothetical protein
MVCENCIIENEFDPDIHIIEDGPFDTQAECQANSNSPLAFFSIDIDAPGILSETQDLVITDLVIKLTDQNLIDSVTRQIAGLEPTKYLRGNIVDEFVWYNPEYDYHVDPNSIYFVDDIEALSNNQQNLDSYTIQAGRKLPKNAKVKSQKSPKQPQPDCSGCANTVFIPYFFYGSYCRCADGIAPQKCPTSDCGVYVNTQQAGGSMRRVWNPNTVCIPSPKPAYEWNETFCDWRCPDQPNRTVAEARAYCENQTTFGYYHTFKEETCECTPPTTCAPCSIAVKIRPNKGPNGTGGSGYVSTPGSDCTTCECATNNNLGEPLCGSDGKISNIGSCECECDKSKLCPQAEKVLVNPNLKWTPVMAGANHYPPCACECKDSCSPPFVQNVDDCSCNCPTGPLPVYTCTKNGQTLCVECSSDNEFSNNTCVCECGPITCPPMKAVTRISGGTSSGVEKNPICPCRCPEGDIQCLCSYSSNGNPDGLSGSQVMCPGNKEYIIRQDNGQCDCVCKNPKTNEECGPGKVWNDADCQCKCAPNHAPCLYGQEFNQDTCECECPTAIFNESFVSGTLDQESLQCLYSVTCYRCEECPTGRPRNLAKEIIQGKVCSDFVYDTDKHYFSSCDDCETLDIVTDAELTDPNNITATISKITSTGGAESFDEIEIELVKSNSSECCSEAVLNNVVKRTLYGYSLKSLSTTQIPTNPGTCTEQ